MSDASTTPLEPAEDVRLLLTTAPPDAAEALAQALVEPGLAACVNLFPGVRSVYRWEGAVQNDPETVLLVKTSNARLDALSRELLRLHPYQVPELLVLGPEGGSVPYLAWLRGALGEEGRAP